MLGALTPAAAASPGFFLAPQLTLVLKDSFTKDSARTVMIATVSPAASSADHTLNTLRYADRIKERKVGAAQRNAARENVMPPQVSANEVHM